MSKGNTMTQRVFLINGAGWKNWSSTCKKMNVDTGLAQIGRAHV